MNEQLESVKQWIEERTGLFSFVEEYFDEDIPASAGWHQVFGSVALFILVTQFVTGALLAFNYAPQPEAAYYSLQYIITEVTAGALMRGLHHWGATMMVIVVVLHMVQVAIWGAYKRPREVTWLLGVVLLLLTLGFGLTGYLLPWDNRSYWATVVTIQIAGLPPVAGEVTQRLLGSTDGTVGVATFQRFYALHTMVLPAITALLAAFHVILVRRHGVAPQPGDEALPTKKFYPGQVFKDSAAIFGVFTILFLLASFADAPLGALADPTDSSFVPRPEWYFLFLFEALKLFHGSLEVVAAVVLPTVAVIALAAVPFIDRGKMQRVRQRVKALAIVGVSGVAWIVLTVAAIVTTPPEAMEGGVAEVVADWSELTPAEISGWAAYQSRKCWSCHNLTTGGPMPGPSLALLVQRKPSDWTREHFSANGASDLDAQQTSDLALFTSTVQADQAPAYEAVPPAAVAGAVVYQKYACGMCHQVADEGQTIGPPLDNVGSRRDAQWLEGHFRNPQAFVEGSTMPPYDLPSDEMQPLVAYMLALK